MSGILGLNVVERAASKGMGLGSYKTKNGLIVSVMQNPQNKTSQFWVRDLTKNKDLGGWIYDCSDSEFLTKNCLSYLKQFAMDSQEFDRAVENSLHVVV